MRERRPIGDCLRPPNRAFPPATRRRRTGDSDLYFGHDRQAQGRCGPGCARWPRFQIYAEFGLGICADDLYWNAADPGWGYGLYFGILAAFSTGVPGHPAAKADSRLRQRLPCSSALRRHQLCAAPTVFRALRTLGGPRSGALKLRCASSAGEPLTPEVNEWARDSPRRGGSRPLRADRGRQCSSTTISIPRLRRPIEARLDGAPDAGLDGCRPAAEARDELAPPGAPRGRMRRSGQPARSRGSTATSTIRRRAEEKFCRWRPLVSDGRHRPGRRGRLLPFLIARRRRHHHGRLSHRSVRSRICASRPTRQSPSPRSIAVPDALRW